MPCSHLLSFLRHSVVKKNLNKIIKKKYRFFFKNQILNDISRSISRIDTHIGPKVNNANISLGTENQNHSSTQMQQNVGPNI